LVLFVALGGHTDYKLVERGIKICLCLQRVAIFVVLLSILVIAAAPYLQPLAGPPDPDWIFVREHAQIFSGATDIPVEVIEDSETTLAQFKERNYKRGYLTLAAGFNFGQFQIEQIIPTAQNQPAAAAKFFLLKADRAMGIEIYSKGIVQGNIKSSKRTNGSVFRGFPQENLSWRAAISITIGDGAESPDLENFHESFLGFMRLWSANAQMVDTPIMRGRLRYEMTTDGVLNLWVVKRGTLPFGVVLSVFSLAALIGIYSAYCRETGLLDYWSLVYKEFGRGAPLPDPVKFLRTNSLRKLAEKSLRDMIRFRQRLLADQPVRTVTRPVRNSPVPTVQPHSQNAPSGKRTEENLKRQTGLYYCLFEACSDARVQDQALKFYDQAEASDDEDQKIGFLKQAIQILEAAFTNEHSEAWLRKQRAADRTQPSHAEPQIYATLDSEIERTFPSLQFLPERVDTTMTKAIVLSMLQLGYAQTRIERNPLPANFLRLQVRKYHVKLDMEFDKRVFKFVFGWLENQGVVKFSGKTTLSHEGGYSLCGKIDDPISAEARKLVATYTTFEREFRASHSAH